MKKIIVSLIAIGALLLTANGTHAATLINRTQGRILLQVQSRGEAWYVNPVNNKRYYLRDGHTAKAILGSQSIGISEADIVKIPIGISKYPGADTDNDGLDDKLEAAIGTDPKKADTDNDGYGDSDEIKNVFNPVGAGAARIDTRLAERLKGRIVIQSQARGQAWYVNPVDGRRYYMPDGQAAMALMRSLGLGISNRDLVQVSIAPTSPRPPATTKPLPMFASCGELRTALAAASTPQRGELDLGLGLGQPIANAPASSLQKTAESSDFSRTNVQVEGVDEADIVKTDGRYIYALSGRTINIAAASNGQLSKISAISFDDNDQVREFFLSDNRLIVFGIRYVKEIPVPLGEQSMEMYIPSQSRTFVRIYNVANSASPAIARELEFEGTYTTSRLIGGVSYLVANSSPIYLASGAEKPEEELVPHYRDVKVSSKMQPLARCADVASLPPIISSQYLIVASIPVVDPMAPIDKQVILGAGDSIYASLENLYVAKQNYSWAWWGSMRRDDSSSESTTIQKFALADGKIQYVGTASVPGRILNQFSMDEFESNFRVATTEGHVIRGGATTNNGVYVLDAGLKQVGAVTDIAPGEQIYSARFMGKRGYLVTFKKVDPFFTLDLQDPTNPRVVGKLKIPGFSDYLHPLDDNHILGVGKDTEDAEQGNFAWYQGLKLAIFDVSDFANPKELHRVIIGDRGTDSAALHDHKAFLYSADKHLLVIPVTLAEIPAEQKKTSSSGSTSGAYTFQGAFVYDITPARGFVERARISHIDSNDDSYLKSGYYYNSPRSILRSLYIGNILFTVSSARIQANSLTNLEKVSQVEYDVIEQKRYLTE